MQSTKSQQHKQQLLEFRYDILFTTRFQLDALQNVSFCYSF